MAAASAYSLLAGPVAHAQGNAALWGERAPRIPAWEQGVLAEGRELQLGIEVEPGLQWRHLDGDDALTFQAGAYAFASYFRETPRLGYALRLHDVFVDTTVGDTPIVAGTRRTARLGRLGVHSAEAEGRWYPSPQRQPLFVGGTVGAYGAGLSLEGNEAGNALYGAWPISAAGGAGWGRVLPITPRVGIAHLERLLRGEGLLAEALPESLRRQLVLLWAAHVGDLGHNQQAIEAMRLLHAAGVLRAPLSPTTAYRIERIVQYWVAAPSLPRWHGTQAWLLLRGTHSPTGDSPFAWGMTLELRGRAARLHGLTGQWWFEPGLGWAPRASDRESNVLLGLRRASGFDVRPLSAPLRAHAVRISLPLRYERIVLDAYDNLRARHSIGMSAFVGASRRWEWGIDAQATSTLFFSGAQGLKVGLAATAAHAAQTPQFQGQVTLAYVQGTGTAYYVAPAHSATGRSQLESGSQP